MYTYRSRRDGILVVAFSGTVTIAAIGSPAFTRAINGVIISDLDLRNQRGVR